MLRRERETIRLLKRSLWQRLWSCRKADSGMNIVLRFLLSLCDLTNTCVCVCVCVVLCVCVCVRACKKTTAVIMLKILDANVKIYFTVATGRQGIFF
jgi:hypothetical protein